MDLKKFVLYYGLESETIGVREHLHDWKEGETLYDDSGRIFDAKQTVIYAIIWGTEKNVEALVEMFRELNTATSMKGVDYYFFDETPYILDYLKCTPYTVKKRQYGDYEKRLDFMEEFVNNRTWE